MEQAELKSDGWRLESPQVLRLLEKLTRAGKPLGEYVDGKIYRGIITGLNEAFIVDQPTRDRLIAEHASSSYLLKPILRGRDVKRWRIDYSGRYLIKIESSENKQHPWSGMDKQNAELKFAKCYPAIYTHLKTFREALIRREDQGKYYWELRSCKYWDEFALPKIIYPDIAPSPQFAFDRDHGYFTVNTIYTLPGQPYWMLGLLNSHAVFWFYRSITASIQSGFIRFFTQYVVQIPVPSRIEASPLSNWVSQLVEQDLPLQAREDLERAINQEVYRLYGLTDAEIQIIEDAIQSEGDQ